LHEEVRKKGRKEGKDDIVINEQRKNVLKRGGTTEPTRNRRNN
jgi:hypothetical protein